MATAHDALWIKDALVFLGAAGVVVPLLRVARVPNVVAFVIAGLALGPSGLGALSDQFEIVNYFTITEPEATAPFSELGVLFLLFLLGLELSFEKLWALKRVVFGAGALQSGLSTLAIATTLILLGFAPLTAVTIGLAFALSSTAIVMQLMIDQHRAATPVGRSALGVLLFQDILVAPILIFVGFASANSDAPLGGVIAEALVNGLLAIAIIVLIGRFVLGRVFRLAAHAGGRDLLMALTLLTVVGAAAITASAGLSLALGAFLAGLLLGETEYKHQTEVDLEPFKGLLLGLFFMSVGMSIDIRALVADLPVILGGLAALLFVKLVIAWLACRVFVGPQRVSIETAFVLAPAGEFAFVIVAAALAGGLVDAQTAGRIAAIAALSMVTIPFMDRLGRLITGKLSDPPDAVRAPEDYKDLEGHVIIAGFGRVGHAIGRMLRAEKADVVALDRDAMRVFHERENGWDVYFGDAARPEILERAGAHGAALFIVTVDDPAAAEKMVRAVRSVRPDAPILARARDAEHARELAEAGASFVIPDAIEAGLQLAGRALREFGYATETVRDLIAAERDQEYRLADAPAE